MTPERYAQIREVFLAARDLAGAEREACLDANCAADSTLRSQVEHLLSSEATATQFLDEPVADRVAVGPASEQTPQHPSQIGPYRILGVLGEGGMGIVYRAEQIEPIRRTVAVKVIRRGMNSRQVVARFEWERQALALMNHPNVARVYDAGTTDEGQPYFAMEFVEGRPITEYCDRNALSVRQRLELFARACDGVQHAHQRGVIHRDITPNNVLVEQIDEQATPKVIDFGIAKAVREEDPEATTLTVQGSPLGTPAFMSPEQAEMRPDNIDTRTDVYSLGVTLYKLLTDRLPYPMTGSLPDVLRNITQTSPVKPSAHNRNLDDEIDALLLTALAKEPERRYQTTAALAEDIRQYLIGRPIRAKGDSLGYVLKKALAPHRRLIAVGLVAVTALVVAAGFGWVHRQHKQATQEYDDAARLIDTGSSLREAREHLNRAVELSPRYAAAYRRRAQVNAKLGLAAAFEDKDYYLQAAIDDCEQAFEFGVPSALLLKADLLQSYGQEAEATACLTRARQAASRGAATEGLAVTERIRTYEYRHDPLARPPSRLFASPQISRAVPDREATLRYGLRTPVGELNPLGHDPTHRITELIFEPLFRVELGESDHPVARPNPAMVADVNRSAKDLEWRITLRPNLHWHDGQPLTAQDVMFSWEADSFEEQSPLTVEVDNETSVLVRFTEPTAAPEWLLDFPIIPRAHYARCVPRDEEVVEDDSVPVGSGPYRWTAESTPRLVVLERWPDYAGDEPYFERIEFAVLADRDERVTALAENRIDLLELNASEFRWAVTGQSFAGHTWKINQPRWAYEHICWNAAGADSLFADRRVRLAMTRALDLTRIIGQRFGGLYSPCTGAYDDDAWMTAQDIAPYTFDANEARRLLEAVGWTLEHSTDGIRRRRGRRFEFTLLVPEESYDFQALTHDLQRDLRAVGVAMNVELLPWNECLARAARGEFEAYAGRVLGSSHPHSQRERWTTDAPQNYAGYSKLAVDQLYEQAGRTLDPTTQAQLYREIHSLIYSDQPYTFLWRVPILLAVNDRLRGVQVSPKGVSGFWPGPRAWWTPKPD